jgi:hypothetical protein
MLCASAALAGGKLPPAKAAEAQKLWHELAARQLKVVALCGLAGKATALPDEARRIYGLALAAARDLDDPRAHELARELAGRGDAGRSWARALEGMARAAWPLRLVAQGALTLDREQAARALELGLERARANPSAEERSRDLAGLAVVLARLDLARARGIVGEVDDPLWRAWAWRELAMAGKSRKDLLRAAQAARQAQDRALGAVSLARAAALAWGWEPALGRRLFSQALDLAGAVADPQRRAWAKGRVAALVARAAPRAALDAAKKLVGGAGFAAQRLAALELLGRDRVSGRRALLMAWRSAGWLSGGLEQARAMSLLARDAAHLAPDLSSRILRAIPRENRLLRVEAEAAMVLGAAGRDLEGAVARAWRLSDRFLRLVVLARLAGILARRDAARGRALYRRVLAAMGAGEEALPVMVLARAWRELEAEAAVRLASGLAPAARKVRALVRLARRLHVRGEGAAAEWCLQLAVNTIKRMGRQQILDKVGLLGDMGREWSAVDLDRARGFFRLGAELSEGLG